MVSNLLQTAKEYAEYHHKFQTYGNQPYTIHLDNVVSILYRYRQPYIVVVAGYLHDVIEDTPVTYQDVLETFGRAIADIVWAVTDEDGENRKARKLATYPKIRSTRFALGLKLADRISNHSRCLEQNNIGLLEMYTKEYPSFKKHLYSPVDNQTILEMWNELDDLYKLSI